MSIFTRRSLFALFFLSTTSVILASPTPTHTVEARDISINPPLSSIEERHEIAREPVAFTNAQRLARGLPLKRPYKRTGTITARTSTVSPTLVTGNILATGTDGTSYGFISPSWNGFGEYGQFQTEQAGALKISFSYIPGAATQLNFLAVNGPSASFPYFGATVGFSSTSDDLASGSYNYVFLTGTSQTAPGDTPVSGDNSFSSATSISKGYESAIWTYDPSTKAITAQWINSDGSSVDTTIVYANDDNEAIVLTGDASESDSAFGVPYPVVTFTLVPCS